MKRASPEPILTPFVVDIEQFAPHSPFNCKYFEFLTRNHVGTTFLDHFLSNSKFCRRFYSVSHLYKFVLYVLDFKKQSNVDNLFTYEMLELACCCSLFGIPLDVINCIKTALINLMFAIRKKNLGPTFVQQNYDNVDNFDYITYYSTLSEIQATFPCLEHYTTASITDKKGRIECIPIEEPVNKYDQLCILLAHIVTTFRFREIRIGPWAGTMAIDTFFRICLIVQMLKNDACNEYTAEELAVMELYEDDYNQNKSDEKPNRSRGKYNPTFLFNVAFKVEERIMEMAKYILTKRGLDSSNYLSEHFSAHGGSLSSSDAYMYLNGPTAANVDQELQDWINIIQALLIYVNLDPLPISSKANPINIGPKFFYYEEDSSYRGGPASKQFWDYVLICCLYPTHNGLMANEFETLPQWGKLPEILLLDSSNRIESVRQGIVKVDNNALLVADKWSAHKYDQIDYCNDI